MKQVLEIRLSKEIKGGKSETYALSQDELKNLRQLLDKTGFKVETSSLKELVFEKGYWRQVDMTNVVDKLGDL